jgi:hypothetical protein
MALGTVLVFKEGVNAARAAEALRKIEDVLEPCWLNYSTTDFKPTGEYPTTPFVLNQFDPALGGPVWYIP